MIHAVIPTRSCRKINKNLLDYYKRCNINVLAVEGKSSIFEAFSKSLTYIADNDIAILCHDDIEIWSDERIFKYWLEKYCYDPEYAFVGVAGCKHLMSNGVWWDGLINGTKNLAGMAYHPTPGNPESTPLTYFGAPFAQVEAMDGLFLAIEGKKLKKLGVEKPDWMPEESNWDFYDINLTYKAFKKGYKNIIVPIQIFHESPGIPRDSWNAAREAFVKRYFGG